MTAATADQRTLFGHPTGLYTLFFAEMWERFSYYGMRALLVFYMIKGFLKLNDADAYATYGAYTAMVYATPFIGGMLADRLLGARRAVVLGGLLMAAGHLAMTWENGGAFYSALALLIVGNGFFKPNISTIVGNLYPQGSPKRDGGFTIFYMGINLGAAMSPLVCGYVGETFGWHYGFGLATIGMLAGLAVFVAPVWLTKVLILGGALGVAVSMFWLQDNPYQLAVNIFVAVALASAGVIAFVALGRGGLPDDAGLAENPDARKEKIGPITKEWAVYLGIIVSIPVFALLVQRNEIAGIVLSVFGAIAFVWLIVQAVKSEKIERERLFVVLILMFFSMLFWAFFEQAGSSVSNFTDRNVDRVSEIRKLDTSDVGKTVKLKLSQEQFGYPIQGDKLFTVTALDAARTAKADTIDLTVTEAHVGMGIEGNEVPASIFQAANPVFILIFGLLFTALWGFLGRIGKEPSIPVKFALGLLQLGLGFGAMWYGASISDERGMVSVVWLLSGYLLHTTGELCISPVGLSMVTRLSPARIVSTVMGAWFLALAFSNYLAALIAGLTGVSHGGEEGAIPIPLETVNVYGDVFGKIAIAAVISSVICLALAPLLNKWTHADEH